MCVELPIKAKRAGFNLIDIKANEKARIVKTLVEIDPTNSSNYQKINESNQGR